MILWSGINLRLTARAYIRHSGIILSLSTPASLFVYVGFVFDAWSQHKVVMYRQGH